MKHTRAIVLEPWQEEIVDHHAEELICGLFHSDGCRVIDRIKGPKKTYEYPRYQFSNESADIMRICQKSLDRLGIRWRTRKPNMLSVARCTSVERLDGFVGPKS